MLRYGLSMHGRIKTPKIQVQVFIQNDSDPNCSAPRFHEKKKSSGRPVIKLINSFIQPAGRPYDVSYLIAVIALQEATSLIYI
jgi:hypothetical protein